MIFYPYSQYLLKTFGAKTYKVILSSGLTCPTRDGRISTGGCAFCDERGSSSFFGDRKCEQSIRDQIRKQTRTVHERFGADVFLAYFQSYTNTYADVPILRKLYETTLEAREIRGICVGTRPDCLPDEVLALLEELGRKTYISIELGIQSFEDTTLSWLERGHDGQCAVTALSRIQQQAPHVRVCAHLIFGSPTDSTDMARNAAHFLNAGGVQGVKLHQLMVLENTRLGERWKKEPFPTLGLEAYAERVVTFLEHLSPDIYIERLHAMASHHKECLAPEWSKQRWSSHNRLRQFLIDKCCKQGRLFPAQTGSQ